MMALRIGIALMGLTLFSWLVSYYSSREKPSAENFSKNTPTILVNSFLQGKSGDQPDYTEGFGHEDGGGDEVGE